MLKNSLEDEKCSFPPWPEYVDTQSAGTFPPVSLLKSRSCSGCLYSISGTRMPPYPLLKVLHFQWVWESASSCVSRIIKSRVNPSSHAEDLALDPAFSVKPSWVNPKSPDDFSVNITSDTTSIAAMAFNTMDDQIAMLRKQVAATENQLQSLKSQLSDAESRVESARQQRAASEHLEQAYQGGLPAEWISETLAALSPELHGYEDSVSIRQDSGHREFVSSSEEPAAPARWPLSGEEYKRYGRQMIMPEIGLHGQLRLKNARVLIVGVGGLGCPAAAYLAGAGVGRLGLIDGDVVEVSNLHRQVAHGASRVGMSKVESAYAYLSEYVETHQESNSQNHPFLTVPPVSTRW